jgi:hypothetical protein
MGAGMTNDIVEWLRGVHARIEKIARSVSDDHHQNLPAQGDDDLPLWVLDDNFRYDTLVITRPAVLARIEAERAILDGYVDTRVPAPWDGCGDDCEWLAVAWVIKRLAWGWRHMPGYRDEWAPE